MYILSNFQKPIKFTSGEPWEKIIISNIYEARIQIKFNFTLSTILSFILWGGKRNPYYLIKKKKKPKIDTGKLEAVSKDRQR